MPMRMNSADKMVEKNTAFHRCPNCEIEWISRDEFLKDPDIQIIGYQVHFEELTAGLFYFNHSCRGTTAIHMEAFKDLYDGPIFEERLTGSDTCPDYCRYQGNLMPCPNKCECVSVREIIQVIKNGEKD